MDVLEALKTRRSIRKYLDVPIEWEKVGAVLEAGRIAPSAGNTQEWNFIVVTDAEARQKIAELTVDGMWMANAPVHLIITTNPETINRYYGIRGERLYTIQDCAVAATYMMLAAHQLGLGTCWIGAFDENALRRVAGIPDSIRPQLILTLGYPDEKPDRSPRKILENIVFLNAYGNRIKDLGFVLWDYNVVGKAVELGRTLGREAQAKMREQQDHSKPSLKAKLDAQKEKLREKLLGKKAKKE